MEAIADNAESNQSTSAVVVSLMPRWLGYEQAASYSSLSQVTLRRLVAAGKLTPHRPVRGKVLLDRLEIDSYINAATSRPRSGRGLSTK